MQWSHSKILMIVLCLWFRRVLFGVYFVQTQGNNIFWFCWARLIDMESVFGLGRLTNELPLKHVCSARGLEVIFWRGLVGLDAGSKFWNYFPKNSESFQIILTLLWRVSGPARSYQSHVEVSSLGIESRLLMSLFGPKQVCFALIRTKTSQHTFST